MNIDCNTMDAYNMQLEKEMKKTREEDDEKCHIYS
jgi:hypothetical protein